jgi:hypothetical protein
MRSLQGLRRIASFGGERLKPKAKTLYEQKANSKFSNSLFSLETQSGI